MNDLTRSGLKQRQIIDRPTRDMFWKLLRALAEADRKGFPFAGDIDRDPFTSRAIVETGSMLTGDFSIFPALDRFRQYELECPTKWRAQVSPRLDFRADKTYADVAQTVLRALLTTAKPHFPGSETW